MVRTQNPGRGKKLARSMLAGITWQYLSVFAKAFLNLFVLATLSRLLSPAEFGVMGTAFIFVGLAELVSELGVGAAIIQMRELTDEHIRVGFSITVVLGIGLVGILWMAAPFVALFFRNNDLTKVVQAISLQFLLGSFGVVAEGLVRRRLHFRKLMLRDIMSYVFGYALVGITLAWRGFGVWALVAACLCQTACKSLLLLLMEPHPLKPSFARRELADLAYFGGGVTLARLFTYCANQGDYFVVGRLSGMVSLGIYTRAYRLMMLPGAYFGQALDGVLFPVMARMQQERSRLTRMYLTGVTIVGLVMAPVGILMAIMASEMVNIILGAKWSEATVPFQVLALGVLPRVSYKIDNSVARAMGAVYQRSIRDGIYALAVVLGASLGIRYGLAGVAVGVLGALILNSVMALQMSVRLLQCPWSEYLSAQAPGLLLALAVSLVAIPTRLLLHVNGAPDWLTLLVTCLICGLCVAGAVLWQPRRIVGTHGLGAIVMLFESVPLRVIPPAALKWFNTKVVQNAA